MNEQVHCCLCESLTTFGSSLIKKDSLLKKNSETFCSLLNLPKSFGSYLLFLPYCSTCNENFESTRKLLEQLNLINSQIQSQRIDLEELIMKSQQNSTIFSEAKVYEFRGKIIKELKLTTETSLYQSQSTEGELNDKKTENFRQIRKSTKMMRRKTPVETSMNNEPLCTIPLSSTNDHTYCLHEEINQTNKELSNLPNSTFSYEFQTPYEMLSTDELLNQDLSIESEQTESHNTQTRFQQGSTTKAKMRLPRRSSRNKKEIGKFIKRRSHIPKIQNKPKLSKLSSEIPKSQIQSKEDKIEEVDNLIMTNSPLNLHVHPNLKCYTRKPKCSEVNIPSLNSRDQMESSSHIKEQVDQIIIEESNEPKKKSIDYIGTIKFESFVLNGHINYKCLVPGCDQIYARDPGRQNRKNHVFDHYPQKLSCAICKIDIFYPDDLRNHIKSAHSLQSLLLQSESIDAFERKVNNARYSKRSERPKKEKMEMVLCQICGAFTYGTRAMKNHMRSHCDKRPFACAFEGCEKTFKSKEQLTIHGRTHTGERPYNCPFCKKTFAQACSFRVHVKTHAQVNLFKCEICLQTFKMWEYLYVHLRRHRKKDEEAGNLNSPANELLKNVSRVKSRGICLIDQ